MATLRQFPDDENGHVLRRMYDGGDPLNQPRMVDFCFIFRLRQQAIAFAELVDEHDLEVCISYYEEREMWQVVVGRYMIPTHQAISTVEFALTARAHSVDGEADDWGCMRLTQQNGA